MGMIHGERSPDDAKNELMGKIAKDHILLAQITYYARRFTTINEDREDYVQETYARLNAWMMDRSVEEIRNIKPLPFMKKVMANHHIDVLRKANKAPSPDGSAGELGHRKSELPVAQLGEESIETLSDLHQEENKIQSMKSKVEEQVVFGVTLNNMLKKISVWERELVFNLLFDRCTPREFALERGLSLRTVQHQVQQLKKKLHKLWKEETN